jgi:hypothetical protein
MDRNDSNPGMVERQMDETPMEGSAMDRDSMQGGSVEREGMQGAGGGSVERENPEGGGQRADNMEGMTPATNADGGTSDQMMRADQREGGYGYDRPVDTTPARDMDPQERSADRDGMHGAGREGSSEGSGERAASDQGRESPDEGTARDW